MSFDPTLGQRAVAALHNEVLSNPVESVGDLLGLANIILLTRRSIWNFPVGIAMVSMLGYVFFKAHLYSDTLTQLYFFIVQIVGWSHGCGIANRTARSSSRPQAAASLRCTCLALEPVRWRSATS